jgi:hypothetical protein
MSQEKSWSGAIFNDHGKYKSWQEKIETKGFVNWWKREDLQEQDIISLQAQLTALEVNPSINKETLVNVLKQLPELKEAGDVSSANTYEQVLKNIKNCLDELHKNEEERGSLNIIEEVLKQTLERSLEVQRGI